MLMAKAIIKDYKQAMHGTFLYIRGVMWHVQFTALLFVLIVGYPTSLADRAAHKIKAKPSVDPDHLALIDNVEGGIFWLFTLGIHKDSRKENEIFFYRPLIFMAIGLIFEKNFIAWLENRWGCSYYRLQKFVELETRCEQIQSKLDSSIVPWAKVDKDGNSVPPQYLPERYQNYYYDMDFPMLMLKFTENLARQDVRRQAHLKEGIFSDFVPYHKAKRIAAAIKMSIRVDGRAPSIVLNEKTGHSIALDPITKNVLNEFDAVDS
jgi:hypothetical protein